MNFFEQLEDETLLKLAPLVTAGIDVELFPDKKAGLQPAIEKPRVTIMYAKEVAKDNQSTDRVEQESDVMILIKVECTSRRGDLGLYDVFERVKRLLLGWYPPHCIRPVILKEGGYDELKDQTWEYYDHFQTTRFIVEDVIDPDGPILNQLNFYSDFEGSPGFDGSFEGSS